MFKLWYLRLILNYPIDFHDHITPTLWLTLQFRYNLSKWDTISKVSAKNEGLKDTPFNVLVAMATNHIQRFEQVLCKR